MDPAWAYIVAKLRKVPVSHQADVRKHFDPPPEVRIDLDLLLVQHPDVVLRNLRAHWVSPPGDGWVAHIVGQDNPWAIYAYGEWELTGAVDDF